jgi:tagaturonate epimerase
MSSPSSTAGLLALGRVEPRSLVVEDGAEFAFARAGTAGRLAILAPSDDPGLLAFAGEASEYEGKTLLRCPCSPENAAALRARLPWLRPQPLGLRTSAGMGDRLGLATPGHVRAVRAAGGDLAPIFAQQSIREMVRTGRSPQEVMDDATWGAFAEGWREPCGADADHLKTTDDVDACVAAGYTFYTIDPGEHVDNAAETAAPGELRAMLDALPWPDLEDSASDLLRRYAGQSYDLEGHTVGLDEEQVARAAVKYGRAVAHVARLYRHLMAATGGEGCELEVSVDETERVTSHAEHLYIAGELQRLGVRWVSLAPRYVGDFEKGVDYIGDVGAFEADFAVHAAIARRFGPYKLSLHSGSDKFSVYEPAARQTRGLVHLKTAGTSYLEALRTIAALDPAFFRTIYVFAREHFETDRATYHISGRLDRAPEPEALSDADLPALLEQFDARQILHVTFGSVLRYATDDGRRPFYDHLMALLREHPEAYAANVERHFLRHLRPFAGVVSRES